MLVVSLSAPVLGNRAGTGRGRLTGTSCAGVGVGDPFGTSVGGSLGTAVGGSVGTSPAVGVGVSKSVRCFLVVGVALGGTAVGVSGTATVGVGVLGTATVGDGVLGRTIGVRVDVGTIGVAVAGSGLGVIFASTVAKLGVAKSANGMISTIKMSAARIRMRFFMFVVLQECSC